MAAHRLGCLGRLGAPARRRVVSCALGLASLAARGASPATRKWGTATDFHTPLMLETTRFGERKSDGSPPYSPSTSPARRPLFQKSVHSFLTFLRRPARCDALAGVMNQSVVQRFAMNIRQKGFTGPLRPRPSLDGFRTQGLRFARPLGYDPAPLRGSKALSEQHWR